MKRRALRRWMRVAVMVLLAPWLAARAATVDLHLASASEDTFRGIVQNNSLTGTVRGSLRLANGLHVGSRVLNNRSSGGVQMDFSGGIARTRLLADLLLVSFDAGLNVSVHTGDRRGPEGRDLDWAEVRAGIGSGPLRIGVAYAPDYFGTGAAAWHLAGQVRWPLGVDTGLTATLGWNEGVGVGRHLARRGGAARYADAGLGLDHRLRSGFTVFGQLNAASIELDASRRPRLLVGLRWRWGRQLARSTGR